MGQPPRLTTVMGVARAVLATVRPETAARVLVDEFGWDAALQALAVLGGADARTAFGAAWTTLLTDPITAALPSAAEIDHRVADAAPDDRSLRG